MEDVIIFPLDVLSPVRACCVCLPCLGLVPTLLPVNGSRDGLISKVTRLWSLRLPDRSEVHPVSPTQWVRWDCFSGGNAVGA
jgi:hypothetical protein